MIIRAGASLGVIALTAGIALVGAPAANADEIATSYAEGQFLSGTLGGMDLATVVDLASAEARNNGTQEKQTSDDPLDASVLQTVTVEAPNGIQADAGDNVNSGVVNQYAEADRNGVSFGASGAIGDDGAIGVGAVQNGAAGDVDVDLDSALNSRFNSVLSSLTLTLKAVAAQASGNRDTATGDYHLEGAILTFTSPAMGDLPGKVNTALGTVDDQLAELSTEGGALDLAVGDILDPALAVVGSSANVSITIDNDARTALQSLLTGTYRNDAVTIDMETGEVKVDLAKLVGGDLNNLPVNTELLSAEVVHAVTKNIATAVSTLADQIVDRVDVALHDATVEVHADLDLLSPQASPQNQVCTDVKTPIIGDVLGAKRLLGTGGTSGLGSTTQGIVGYTTETVCELAGDVLPDLRSTVNLDIEGTVDQILNGTAAKAAASLSLLGGAASPTLNVSGIIDGLGAGLGDGLFDSDGAVSVFTDNLHGTLVEPVTKGLLSDAGIGTALTDVVSVKVNLQETSMASPQGYAVATGSYFTQTAVRVYALNGAGTLSIAAATVGPNITTVVDPGCTVNCGPGNPGDPGTPGHPGTSTAADRLAYTGVGIAALIAIVLALLAAGAFLAREGYRRNHTSLTSD